MRNNYINNQWVTATGNKFESINPATEKQVWVGHSASSQEVQHAVSSANEAFATWRTTPFQQRLQFLQKFNTVIIERSHELATLISQETGKPLWDAAKEVQAILGKLNLSVKAYEHRSGTNETGTESLTMELRHQAHGVMAIFGPYNFPCHLPNGHIIPALIAGNTVVFKPSELTPACGEFLACCWQAAELPKGVFNLVQGDKETGKALIAAKHLSGVLFTGSESTGKILHKHFAGRPEVMLALEMGGNNPLIIDKNDFMAESLLMTLESAFISTGQRCTCARRIFVPAGDWGNDFITQLVEMATKLPIGQPDCPSSPFMGTMISSQAVSNLLAQQQKLIAAGGTPLASCQKSDLGNAFVTPGIIDVTDIPLLPDEEIFGPLLQVIRYTHFEQAIKQANQTRFGLAAGLISESESKFNQFRNEIRAGIVNWNRPLTGASSALPFGGIGCSGNHRPSAFYAADYCSFPVSSLKQQTIGGDSSLSQYFPTKNKGNE